MLTENDFCDYDTCVALKELGYEIPTSAYYMPNNNQLIFVSNPFRGGYVIDCFCSHNSFPKDVMTSNYIDAPTMWEAQKWLREEKHLHIEVRWYSNLRYEYEVKEAEGKVIAEGCAFPTYEEALSTAVRMAVESLKENEDGRM